MRNTVYPMQLVACVWVGYAPPKTVSELRFNVLRNLLKTQMGRGAGPCLFLNDCLLTCSCLLLWIFGTLCPTIELYFFSIGFDKDQNCFLDFNLTLAKYVPAIRYIGNETKLKVVLRTLPFAAPVHNGLFPFLISLFTVPLPRKYFDFNSLTHRKCKHHRECTEMWNVYYI